MIRGVVCLPKHAKTSKRTNEINLLNTDVDSEIYKHTFVATLAICCVLEGIECSTQY